MLSKWEGERRATVPAFPQEVFGAQYGYSLTREWSEFEGKVKHVRLGLQTISNVVTYTGIVSIENPKMELLPGMTASVKIETDSRSDALLAPPFGLPACIPLWRGLSATKQCGSHVVPKGFGDPQVEFKAHWPDTIAGIAKVTSPAKDRVPHFLIVE